MNHRRARAPSLLLLAVVATGVPIFALACGKTKGAKISAAECDALRANAEASARKASDEATFVTSDLACYVNADCVELPPPSCVVGCGGYAAPNRARDSVAKALREIEDGACKKWTDEGCATIAPRPVPSCPAYVPACKSSRCIMRDKREILSAGECNAILASANRELDETLKAADRSCKTDDDCVLSLGGCVAGCGGPAVAKRGEAAYKTAHARVDASCKKWWDGDCMSTTPQPMPTCAPMRPRCAGGHCETALGL